MKLYEARTLFSNTIDHQTDCRDAVRDFVRGFANDYKVALTLTLKQSWYDKCGKMRVMHYLSESDVPRIYERFQWQLNKLVWKQRHYRHGESLKFFRAWEDGFGTKRIHLHAAIGNFPPGFKLNTLPELVERAARQCYEIDFEHKEDICDSGWLDYITKEVAKHDTDKILW